jgi:DNA polymerase-1
VSRLLIVDGHAYAYRAFHAIRELRASDGRPTNAIYGFVKMLEKMRLAVSPTHLIVVWDGGLNAERLAALPAYKAQRPEMPEDLRSQLDGIQDFLAAAEIASYRADGVEADDYIATLARRTGDDWNVVIASSDKDFMQLVTARIGLLNPNDKTGTIWGREQVLAKTGVVPEQVSDWLALMGDAVDNIPGVPGVGTKTAAELLKQFGTIENLLAQLDAVKSEKLRAALRAAADAVVRNQKLVRLPEVPCEFAPEKLKVRNGNRAGLRELYANWGFKGMLEALDVSVEKQAELI